MTTSRYDIRLLKEFLAETILSLNEKIEIDPDYEEDLEKSGLESKKSKTRASKNDALPNLYGNGQQFPPVDVATAWDSKIVNNKAGPGGSNIPFSLDHGESWTAMLFGGKVMGNNVSYDVEVTSQPDEKVLFRFEVKQPSGTDEDKTIRTGTKGVKAASNFVTKLNEVSKALSELSDIDTQGGLPEGLEKDLATFKDSYYPDIARGEISTSSQIAVIKILKRLRLHGWSGGGGSASSVEVQIGAKKSSISLDPDDALRIAKLAGINPSSFGKSDLDSKLATLYKLEDGAWIRDPSGTLNQIRLSVLPGVAFSNTDGVVLVSSQGFYIVEPDKFDEAFKFQRATQSKAIFVINKDYLPPM